MSRRLRVLALAAAIAVAGCSVRLPTQSVGPSAATDQPSGPPAPQTPPEDGPPPNMLATELEGLALSVELDRTVVEPGGVVRFRAEFRNLRPEPVDYQVRCRSAPGLLVRVAPPIEPLGLAWPGPAGEFKRYAIEQGWGPGGQPPGSAYATDVQPNPCLQADDWERLLPPGGTLAADFAWPAVIVPGVPASLGEVQYTVSVGYDRQNEPPECPGICNPVGGRIGTAAPALWFPEYKQLSVTGRIVIDGPLDPMLSGGQAIDQVLLDGPFVDWLASAPRATWANANVFLEGGPNAPGGQPNWSVELFLEPRRYAIFHVEPWTGDILRRSFCEVPCRS